jgi:hypothetical protein
MRGELEAAREQMLRSMPEVEAAGEPLLIQRAHDGLALLGWVSGDHVSLRRHSERSLELARQIGSPISELLPRLRLLLADLMIGAWEEAELRSVEGLGLARRLGQPRGLLGAVAMRGLVCAQRGDLSAAESYVAEAWRGLGDRGAADRNVFLMVELAEAVLALERGDATRAVTAASGLNRQFPGTRVWPLGTPLFARAAAVVTDTGGVGSHSSIVAREYGIPCVVGTGDATARLRDGQVVTVDGNAGVVRISA